MSDPKIEIEFTLRCPDCETPLIRTRGGMFVHHAPSRCLNAGRAYTVEVRADSLFSVREKPLMKALHEIWERGFDDAGPNADS